MLGNKEKHICAACQIKEAKEHSSYCVSCLGVLNHARDNGYRIGYDPYVKDKKIWETESKGSFATINTINNKTRIISFFGRCYYISYGRVINYEIKP